MNKELYHVSASDNRENILSIGLQPAIKLDLNIKRRPGVYMFSTLEAAKEWAYWMAVHYRHSMDIWKITLPDEYALEKDTHPEMREFNAYVGYDPISVNELDLFKTQEVPNFKGK